ncbi:MAG: DUF5107 domain-containing protein [Opitutales bacterium]|nr:DUF5107 domain-containing protein [Opitutales bacterium]
MSSKVSVIREPRSIPTYRVGVPEKNPLFFEKRVYQGSSGKVYPLPFIDRLLHEDGPQRVDYDCVRIENDCLRLEILPEIGGRIFLGQDKLNGNYDFFYRQEVIKPALVGLAGPWISGGVEFNWPQHHRPSTFMPADCWIDRAADGSVTVWLSEHDPISRMKGMHGIRIRPGSSRIELIGRLYNRTPITQTFLWWANVAARVHEEYQSFFPEDVTYVADHAVRAMPRFPHADGAYYGIDYGKRQGGDGLSWYRNIPVPTSYMVCETAFDFFGGYDFRAQGGFVHVADKHIAPGKKQWTWGNDAFGRAWDRELTDEGGPYIELMAGVYTDNQPDFSYLLPGETKTFSQCWWPYKGLGPVQNATDHCALRLVVDAQRRIDWGLAVSEPMEDLVVILKDNDRILSQAKVSLKPGDVWRGEALVFKGEHPCSLHLAVFSEDGKCWIDFRPVDRSRLKRNRDLAVAAPPVEEVHSQEELYLIGEHLELYRHPTRKADDYWRKALENDPDDIRCNTALGRKLLSRGCFAGAAAHLRRAVNRLTGRHPNPESGEAHYFLGLALKYLDRVEEAYLYLAKATWNYAWRSAAHYQLAVLDTREGRYSQAMRHSQAAIDADADNQKAIVLRAIQLRRREQPEEAQRLLTELVAKDPLDHWAHCELRFCNNELGDALKLCRNDAQTVIDVVLDYVDVGCIEEGIRLLEVHDFSPRPEQAVPNPLSKSLSTDYLAAWLYHREGDQKRSQERLKGASTASSDYFFPSRLEELKILEWAVNVNPQDRNAHYGLGNYCADKRRHISAITHWAAAVQADPSFARGYRNLGQAYWNYGDDRPKARSSYQRALELDPRDARIFYEYDQLRKKLNENPADRLSAFRKRLDLVAQRDDAAVEFACLLNLNGADAEALNWLENRAFHPWEGGEGKVLRQYAASCLALGEAQLQRSPASALRCFEKALNPPENLGEQHHPLQAKADIYYWIGRAQDLLGQTQEAADCYRRAASESGDFEGMQVREHSVLSYYRGAALRQLGEDRQAQALFEDIRAFGQKLIESEARIDYFATSLPNLLVFDEDLQRSKKFEGQLLIAYSLWGLSHSEGATQALEQAILLNGHDYRTQTLQRWLRA